MSATNNAASSWTIRFLGLCYLIDETRPILGVLLGWIPSLSAGYLGWDLFTGLPGAFLKVLIVSSTSAALFVGFGSLPPWTNALRKTAVLEFILTSIYLATLMLAVHVKVETSFFLTFLITRSFMLIALFRLDRLITARLSGRTQGPN